MAEINGNTYQFGKMDPRTQFHVARRLSPLLGSIVTTLSEGGLLDRLTNQGPKEGEGPDGEEQTSEELPAAAPSITMEDLGSLAAMTESLANLDDAVLDYIFDKTLAVVQRQNDKGAWLKITAANGRMMFDDIDMPTMLQLAWGVIESDLMSFFPERR